MKRAFTILFLFCGFGLFAQTDYWACQVYFSGCPVSHIPKGITIPDRDKGSREIINAVIDGYSYGRLKRVFPDSLDFRLDRLIAGKVIERSGDGFRCLFPVLAGGKRDELQTMIRSRLTQSGISLDTLVIALRKAFPNDPDMIFHFLWSRIIDDCWWNLYNTVFHTDQGPPDIAFIVYPPHPFQCGTNSDYSPRNDMFAMSWSYNIFSDTFSVPASKSFFDLTAKKTIPENDMNFFLRHGLADRDGRSRVFTYHTDDAIDKLCDALKKVYISKVRGLFNYQELSERFQIPADELFLVASHEIAYELIAMLYAENSILIPITRKDNPDLNLRYLVSVRFRK
jgi:hypothetical protein